METVTSKESGRCKGYGKLSFFFRRSIERVESLPASPREERRSQRHDHKSRRLQAAVETAEKPKIGI
jgi:hypothetical protein